MVQVLSNKKQGCNVGMQCRRQQRHFRTEGRKERLRVDILMGNYHAKNISYLLWGICPPLSLYLVWLKHYPVSLSYGEAAGKVFHFQAVWGKTSFNPSLPLGSPCHLSREQFTPNQSAGPGPGPFLQLLLHEGFTLIERASGADSWGLAALMHISTFHTVDSFIYSR